ncbi:hypothetical protein FKM82_019602 [Ascaphus truei]
MFVALGTFLERHALLHVFIGGNDHGPLKLGLSSAAPVREWLGGGVIATIGDTWNWSPLHSETCNILAFHVPNGPFIRCWT